MVAAVRASATTAWGAGLAVLAAAAAGCGSDRASYRNDARPPAPITVTGRIGATGIEISPKSFGAGPVTILVSNQTAASQVLTFETDEVGGTTVGMRRSAGPVGPEGTVQIKADPRQGTYRLAVRDRAIKPVAITVGAPRPSGQNDLLQP
jgi:hypothetical protein